MDDFLTPEDVARKMKVGDAIVASLISDGNLPGFEVYGQWRTTETALSAWSEKMMAGMNTVKSENALLPQAEGGDALPLLPTLQQLRNADWIRVAPVQYTSRNGKLVVWQDDAFSITIKVGDKKAPIVIAVYGTEGPQSWVQKGVTHRNWGAEVFWGEVGHGLRSIAEWVRVDEYKTSRKLASLIKKGKSVLRPDEQVPAGYEELDLNLYNRVITRPYTKEAQCVVAHEDDLGAMCLHALLRYRQNGWI